MGGYGGYVWAAFGFTIVLMIGLLWQSWRLQLRRTDELALLRRTLRGDGPGGRDHPDRPARRLVARKPDAEPAAAGRGPGATDPEPVPADRSIAGS